MAGVGNNGELMSEINVTPFVDVMLVLLIIFMVTAPMMVQGVPVALPETTTAPLPSEEDNLVVTITREGELYINDFKTEMDTLRPKLAEIYANRSDQQIFLRADRDVPYGLVVRVMSEIKEAGISKLGVVTEPLKEERT
ncbi:MAG: protein TolR [Desulfatibacillaceae bacterium]